MADSSSLPEASSPMLITDEQAAILAHAAQKKATRQIQKQRDNLMMKLRNSHLRLRVGEAPESRGRMRVLPENMKYKICFNMQRKIWQKSRSSTIKIENCRKFYAATFTGNLTLANFDVYMGKLRKFRTLSFTERRMPSLDTLDDGDSADDVSIPDEDILERQEVEDDDPVEEAGHIVSHQNLVENDDDVLMVREPFTFEDITRQYFRFIHTSLDERRISTIEQIAIEEGVPLERSDVGIVLRLEDPARVTARNNARAQAQMQDILNNQAHLRLEQSEQSLRTTRAQLLAHRDNIVAHVYGEPSNDLLMGVDKVLEDNREELKRVLFALRKPADDL